MSPVKKQILVVDDDPDIREAMVDTLIDEGFEAVALPDGPSALDYLRKEATPGMVLLDWNMTPMNGLQFMAELGKEPRLNSIPVFLLTADPKAEDKLKLAAFTGFLRKPLDLERLFKVATQYCS